MNKRLIIFDCFGVIFGEIAPVFLRKHLPENQVPSVKEKLFAPADLGTVTYEELLNNMATELSLEMPELLEEWNSLIILNEEIVPIIKRLKENSDIALLSNAPLGLVERIFEEHSLTQLFDTMVISCNIGLAKPDERIYCHCINTLGKSYDEIYMIDDSPANLEPLPQLGIKPIHYKGISSLDVLM